MKQRVYRLFFTYRISLRIKEMDPIIVETIINPAPTAKARVIKEEVSSWEATACITVSGR